MPGSLTCWLRDLPFVEPAPRCPDGSDVPLDPSVKRLDRLAERGAERRQRVFHAWRYLRIGMTRNQLGRLRRFQPLALAGAAELRRPDRQASKGH